MLSRGVFVDVGLDEIVCIEIVFLTGERCFVPVREYRENPPRGSFAVLESRRRGAVKPSKVEGWLD